jgi:hypothetical protein
MSLSTQTDDRLTTTMRVMASALEPAVVIRSMVFVVALVVLLVAHQVGDHVVQTDHQAGGKAGAGWAAARAMAGHLAAYHTTAVVVLVGTFALLDLPLTWAGATAGIGFSAATHALLDRRWPVRAILRTTRSPKFAATLAPVCGMYAADQALHQLALLVSALLIAGL